jgi:hypothetical protein
MFAVEYSLSLFHYFHNNVLANEVLNLFRLDIMPPIVWYWRGIESAMERRCIDELIENGGACEVGMLRRPHHVCKPGLQFFTIA